MSEKLGVIADVTNLDTFLRSQILLSEKTPLTPHSPRNRSSAKIIERGEFFASFQAEFQTPNEMPIRNDVKRAHSISFMNSDRSGDDIIEINVKEHNSIDISSDQRVERDGAELRIPSEDTGDADSIFTERPIKAIYNKSHLACKKGPKPSYKPVEEPFGAPLLGLRGASSLMSELSKSVLRLKDDLFVATFTKPEHYFKQLDQQVVDGASQNESQIFLPNSGKESRGKGRPSLRKVDPKLCSVRVSKDCISMLKSLKMDTSDPDEVILCPLMDNRHTFLEVCQYRSFQFDALRRAKYSSLVMLYYLQNPHAQHLRVSCTLCQKKIKDIRWHCERCVNYDICNECHISIICSVNVKNCSDSSLEEACDDGGERGEEGAKGKNREEKNAVDRNMRARSPHSTCHELIPILVSFV